MEWIILVLIGYGLGLIAMRGYDTAIIHKFGWTWKMIKGKIAKDKLGE